jgi:CheY-like chemotaxis protein
MSKLGNQNAQLRVLVVDDNEDAAASLAVFLEIVGCKTAVAFRGNAGLHIARNFKPDLAFIDLAMPDMDGCELASAIHGRAKYGRPMCVCVTGCEESQRQRCLKAGFDGFVSKPMDNDMLQQTLEACRERSAVH